MHEGHIQSPGRMLATPGGGACAACIVCIACTAWPQQSETEEMWGARGDSGVGVRDGPRTGAKGVRTARACIACIICIACIGLIGPGCPWFWPMPGC